MKQKCDFCVDVSFIFDCTNLNICQTKFIENDIDKRLSREIMNRVVVSLIESSFFLALYFQCCVFWGSENNCAQKTRKLRFNENNLPNVMVCICHNKRGSNRAVVLGIDVHSPTLLSRMCRSLSPLLLYSIRERSLRHTREETMNGCHRIQQLSLRPSFTYCPSLLLPTSLLSTKLFQYTLHG